FVHLLARCELAPYSHRERGRNPRKRPAHPLTAHSQRGNCRQDDEPSSESFTVWRGSMEREMRNRRRAWGLALLGVLMIGGRASADPPPPLTVEMVSYRGWKDCIHLTNGQIELITPTVIGPRL